MDIETVKDLIDELSRYDEDSRIMVTFEGITRWFSIYQAKDGTILIDADGEFYKDKFVSGEFGLPR